MLGLLLVMVVVTGIIIFVLLQTKTTTTTSKTQATKTTTTTAVQTQKADNERKYIESLKVLSNLSESHRLQPYKPRLSITLNNFIVDKDFNVISPGCKSQIQKLAQFFDVYLLLLSSKEEENKAKSFLEEFKGIVPQHKALFCHSEDGLVAMIRQLKPRFHFENNGFVAEKLSQHLNHMIGLRDLQREINENSKKNAKWANILNHNVDFYDSFEDISSHVLQLMKFN